MLTLLHVNCWSRPLIRMGIASAVPDVVREFNETPWAQEPLRHQRLLSYHTEAGLLVRLGDLVELSVPTGGLWRIDKLEYVFDRDPVPHELKGEGKHGTMCDAPEASSSSDDEQPIPGITLLPSKRLGRGIPRLHRTSSSSSSTPKRPSVSPLGAAPNKRSKPAKDAVTPNLELYFPALTITVSSFASRDTLQFRYALGQSDVLLAYAESLVGGM
jgi:hypothetical protein